MSESRSQETLKAAAAFHEYCLLGYDRSLAKLAQKLGKPSAYTRWLETWSSQYHWQERVRRYDEEQSKALDELIATEEKRVLREAFALKHKRIAELNRIAMKLIGYLDDEDNIWLPDVKGIGSGPGAERVDLIRFNDAIFSEIRAHFDDIAKEMGERVKKKEITLKPMPKVYLDPELENDGVEP